MNQSVTFNIHPGDTLTRNVKPLLFELLHALRQLMASGETRVIDLRSIPLAPGEEQKILEFLGQGEVQAKLEALGPSRVCETRYPGIWLVTHYNSDEQIIGRFIEITTCPDILRSQSEDIKGAIEQLSSSLPDPESDARDTTSAEAHL